MEDPRRGVLPEVPGGARHAAIPDREGLGVAPEGLLDAPPPPQGGGVQSMVARNGCWLDQTTLAGTQPAGGLDLPAGRGVSSPIPHLLPPHFTEEWGWVTDLEKLPPPPPTGWGKCPSSAGGSPAHGEVLLRLRHAPADVPPLLRHHLLVGRLGPAHGPSLGPMGVRPPGWTDTARRFAECPTGP